MRTRASQSESGRILPLDESSESGASRERGRAATRARILKAAREIFFRDGFADTNLDEVAARAGVGKGTLYRHFESKAELYVAVLAAGGAMFDEAMRGALADDRAALERLRSIGQFYRRYWTEHPEHFVIFSAVNHQEFIGQLSPGLLAEVRHIWEQPLRRLEQVIADGVRRGELRRCDPWILANVIWRSGNAAVAALVTPRRARVIDCSAEALYDSTLDVLLWGLEARAS
jgi:TetR/AcrR family transcriptional regulator